jgi:hypothetical protein
LRLAFHQKVVQQGAIVERSGSGEDRVSPMPAFSS